MKKRKYLAPMFLAGMVLPLALALGMQGKDAVKASAAFIGEFNDRTSYIEHATKVNGQLADEGFVLLKNDGTLPLAKGSKVSIVGKSSINLARGGAGSGAGSVSSGVTSVDLQKSLTDSGFEVNPSTTSFYNSSASGSGRTNGNDGWKGNSEVTIGETPWENVTDAVKNSFYEYNDLAIQVLTREGSEGCDVLTIDATDSTKFGYSEKHALELSDNEQDLFDNLHDFFDHIVIVINSSNIFECDQFMNDDKVAGILWIGNPGDVGPGAVGRILCGDVNPSGHTVDTWTRDFSKDPTWQNFSDNRHTNVAIPNTSNRLKHAAQDTMFAADGSPMLSYGTDKNYSSHSSPRWLEKDQKVVQGGLNGVKPAAYVSYEEGIYLDYRYYETRYQDILANEGQGAADAWYDSEDGVVFPFGYGLSYTTFEQEIVRLNPKKNATLDKDSDIIEIGVKVTNTGDYAGKDPVQIYWKAPYTKGGIEKADHVLCAFDKTKLLQPGESQIVHLTFHLQDVANYDFTDANKNGHKGYELDAGTYSVLLNKNAHENYDSVDLKVTDGGIQYTTDRFTGNEVTNRFTDRGFYSSMPGEDDIEFTQFSRADWDGTFPTHPTIQDRTVKAGSRFEEFLTHEYNIWDIEEDHNFDYTPEAAYRSEDDAVEGGWTQSNTTLAKGDRIQLLELKDCEPDDPKWDEFINEFTWAEMLKFVENNKMSSPDLSAVGKGGFSEGDGPQKFNIMWWVSSPIIAATFNPKLAHEQGECVGMESQITGKAGWWGPGCNTHRSPFGGRNFEYYAADPFLMGRIAANVVGAATDRGVYAYFKHFAVNDQEKNRESGISFVNEQALREIYLKSFQMVFQEGKSIGVMGSYNRIGLQETAGSYPLMTEVLRGEWGFKGSVLSDMTHSGNGSVNFKCYENVTNRLLAGCNSQLDSSGFNGQTISKWDATMEWAGGTGAPVYEHNGAKHISFSWWNAVRETVKQTMYMAVNCTGMQRGMTMVAGQQNVEVDITDDINLSVELPDGFDTTNIQYALNKRCDLPAGLTFEDGVITGKFQNVGTYYIDVIISNDTETIAYKFVIDVGAAPGGLEDDTPEPTKPTKKGCKGSIAATTALVVPMVIAGAIALKKRKESE